MFTQIKRLAKKSKPLVVAYYIYDDWRTRRNFEKGDVQTRSGSTHSKKTLQESLEYINVVFDDYVNYSGITPEHILDKQVLEVGPGDNFGVALKFLASGAKRVVCLDKFYSKRDPERQAEIYSALRRRFEGSERDRFDAGMNTGGGVLNADKVRYVYGVGIEDASGLFEAGCFDFIVSRAVTEHLYDLDAAFNSMDKLLAPDGYMIHAIDLRDHGMFTDGGMDPLTFLTVPDGVYHRMSYNSGRPNRQLIGYYRAKMAEMGYGSKIFITHLLGVEEMILPHMELSKLNGGHIKAALPRINKMRPSLQPRYRKMSDEDLMVQGIFLVARKPASNPSDTNGSGG